ncbi:hypothetical protein [Sandarakinorhabdus limnophila]|jgi:hypothetical protein|uniref:hypothetical protein n=1 Tax=Sandarakinorhabdus limnophila TaxID=210512 RepID=UPI0026EA4684|nr:hypothetical protein [Sandarakinorhabdus limnophila]
MMKRVNQSTTRLYTVIALTSVLGTSVPLSAQQMPLPSDQPASISQPSSQQVVIPSNTEVVLRMSDELTSKGNQIKVGHTFRLTVAYDVRINGVTAIPSGTPAVGEVTMRTGKGVFGKSGKMEIALRRIDLNGQAISIDGKFRQEGEGNTVAALGAVFFAAGLMFVTGKSAVIPRGRELTGYTQSAVTVAVKS